MPEQTDIQTSELTKEHSGVYASFSEGDEPLLLKLAVSFTGYERAEALLDEEIPDWDFERVKREGQRVWDRKLSAIRIRTTDEAQKRIFYSALYRVFTLASDRSKDNARWSGTEPFWDDNYAYWDTFRSAFPLLHLVDAEASTGNVRSVLDRFRHNGEVCDGFIAGYDRHDEQGGNDIDCVLADAYLKGVKGVDWEAVYQLMKFNADHRRVGFRDAKKTVGEGYLQYKQQGWMPTNPMSTSQTLEFAYNDFCVAQVARGLGHLQDAERYEARSRQWRQLWNPSLESRGFHGFIDARNADGTFAQMDPSQRGNSWGLPLYEGTSWTYSYYMPHELDTLIQLMGGKEAFVDRLQYGFEQKMIDYSNEPGFLCARAFAHAGRPDLSSYWVHHEMREAFDLTGYPGNDDTGSMASWFVFCSMGLFPNAGQSYYYLNAPLFTESDIRLANGKRLRITANAAPNNVYIQSVRVNGKEWTSPFLPHSEIAKGGHITFVLSSSPDNSNLTH
jgi:predicted alpha-1,2-mannosidase